MLGQISANWHEKATHSRGYADNDPQQYQVWTTRWASECLRVLKPGPTVKPLALMQRLIRLVTPPDGLVLDPFAGSGTTAEACILEHVRCITVERDATFLPLIEQRANRRLNPTQLAPEAAEDEWNLFTTAGNSPVSP